MAKKWKTVAANEITKLEELKVAVKRQPDGWWQVGDLDAFIEATKPQTFDEFIAMTEQTIAPYLATTGPVEPLSREWYSRDLRDRIATVRSLIRARKPSLLAVAATELGIALMEAKASSVWDAPLRKQRKAESDRSAATRRAVEARTARDKEFHDRIDRLRKRDPDITATDIARRLDGDFGGDYPDTAQRRTNLAARVRRYLPRKK